MPPRPLHRWKTFWLGIIVLIFLCWVWVTSFRAPATACWEAPRAQYCIGWGSSYLAFAINQRNSALAPITLRRPLPPRLKPTFHIIKEAVPANDPLIFPAPVRLLRHDPTATLLYIAHWVVVLCFLLPWLALLASRSHRTNRQTSATAKT